MIQRLSTNEEHSPTLIRLGRKHIIFGIFSNIHWRITALESPRRAASKPSPNRKPMPKLGLHALRLEIRDRVRLHPLGLSNRKDRPLLLPSQKWSTSTRHGLVVNESQPCVNGSLVGSDRARRMLGLVVREMQRKVEPDAVPIRIPARIAVVTVVEGGTTRRLTLRAVIDSDRQFR